MCRQIHSAFSRNPPEYEYIMCHKTGNKQESAAVMSANIVSVTFHLVGVYKMSNVGIQNGKHCFTAGKTPAVSYTVILHKVNKKQGYYAWCSVLIPQSHLVPAWFRHNNIMAHLITK